MEGPLVALTADAGGSYGGLVGEVIEVHGSASGGTPPYTYSWNSERTTRTGATVEFTYVRRGIYTATLTVTDNVGNTATDTADVIIEN